MIRTGLVRVLVGPGLAMAIVIGVGLWQLSTGSAPASTPVARAVKQDLVVSVGGVGRIVQSTSPAQISVPGSAGSSGGGAALAGGTGSGSGT